MPVQVHNEPYPQLHHNEKMAATWGTLYREPMERLVFRYD